MGVMPRQVCTRPPAAGDVGNVEDAQAAEPLVADIAFDPLQAAVLARTAVPHAHQQQITRDRDIALPAGADVELASCGIPSSPNRYTLKPW